MSDPQRLLDDPSSSPLGRSLIDAAGDDAPSADGRARAAKRLGIAAGLASSAVAGGSSTAAVGTVAAIVVGLGGIVGVAMWAPWSSSPAETPPPVVERAPIRDRVPAPARAEVVEAPAPVVETPAPVVEAPAPVEAPTPIEPKRVEAPRPAEPKRVEAPKPAEPKRVETPKPAAPPPAEAPPPVEAPAAHVDVPAETPRPIDARRLAAEVALLDRARTQLRGGDAASALVTLDVHDRDFADGALVAEASLVRIEALSRAGRSADARRLAEAFVARFPRSPLVQRARALLDTLPR